MKWLRLRLNNKLSLKLQQASNTVQYIDLHRAIVAYPDESFEQLDEVEIVWGEFQARLNGPNSPTRYWREIFDQFCIGTFAVYKSKPALARELGTTLQVITSDIDAVTTALRRYQMSNGREIAFILSPILRREQNRQNRIVKQNAITFIMGILTPFPELENALSTYCEKGFRRAMVLSYPAQCELIEFQTFLPGLVESLYRANADYLYRYLECIDLFNLENRQLGDQRTVFNILEAIRSAILVKLTESETLKQQLSPINHILEP